MINDPAFVIIAVSALVGVASSLLGTFLVLRKNSMLSDAISHSILLGIVGVYLITQNQYSPFFIVGAAATGVLTVFLTEAIVSSGRVKNDAAIGLVYPFLFAVAVLLINLYASNVHIDTHAVLVGAVEFAWINTVNLGGVPVSLPLLSMLAVTLLNALFVILFYKELKLITFDPNLGAALGFSPTLVFYALLSLTSITAVIAFDAVGAVLLVAFVIVPPSAAYLLTDKLWRMLVYGVLISVVSAILGYVSAVALDVSIGGMMAVYTGLFLLLAFLLGPRYGLVAQEIRRSRQREENEARTLMVHLYNHEADMGSEESELTALKTHLRWSDTKAQNVLAYSLDNRLLTQDRDQLLLTAKGRILAQEVLEPWKLQVQA